MDQTKEYFLKVTVTSELLPESHGNVSSNISSGIFLAFRGWENTGVTVEDFSEADHSIRESAKSDTGTAGECHRLTIPKEIENNFYKEATAFVKRLKVADYNPAGMAAYAFVEGRKIEWLASQQRQKEAVNAVIKTPGQFAGGISEMQMERMKQQAVAFLNAMTAEGCNNYFRIGDSWFLGEDENDEDPEGPFTAEQLYDAFIEQSKALGNE